MDGEKIAIEKQDEAADISINSGASWRDNVTEDMKPMIGLVTKLKTKQWIKWVVPLI